MVTLSLISLVNLYYYKHRCFFFIVIMWGLTGLFLMSGLLILCLKVHVEGVNVLSSRCICQHCQICEECWWSGNCMGYQAINPLRQLGNFKNWIVTLIEQQLIHGCLVLGSKVWHCIYSTTWIITSYGFNTAMLKNLIDRHAENILQDQIS